jgi:hypothetical protein
MDMLVYLAAHEGEVVSRDTWNVTSGTAPPWATTR